MQPGEDFCQAGIRECKEEAGIDVVLKGVLRIDHATGKTIAVDDALKTKPKDSMRVIFYAEPTSIHQAHSLKSTPDSESQEAKWVSVTELREMKERGLLRFDELLEWSQYLE